MSPRLLTPRYDRPSTPALAAMFVAAMRSAGPARPHDTHRNSSLVGRFFLSIVPHEGQVREVFRGSTRTTGTPFAAALYSTKERSWRKLQERCRRRWERRTVVRSRMPPSSSRATARFVSSARATMLLEMQWLV